MSFILHPVLERDSLAVGDLPLCRLLLINDAQFPWCLLVPRRASVTDLHQLERSDRHQLSDESHQLCEVMMSLCNGFKMNVAALGNVVPQLHVHHIVRQTDDACWPRPVWGQQPSVPYQPEAADRLIAALSARMDGWLIDP